MRTHCQTGHQHDPTGTLMVVVSQRSFCLIAIQRDISANECVTYRGWAARDLA